MADEDAAYLAWVRDLECAICAAPGPAPPHHSTAHGTACELRDACGGRGAPKVEERKGGRLRGKAQRAHDHASINLCFRHHRQFHEGVGHFAGWTREQRTAWQREQVTALHEVYFTEGF